MIFFFFFFLPPPPPPHYIFNASYARVCDFQTDAGWHQSELLVDLLAAGRGQPKQKGAAPHLSVSSSSEPPGVSSGARPKREHMNRIKEDPVQYKLHREKENKRLQATRANRTPVQKAEAKIKTRKPVQEWRLQQKMLGKVEGKQKQKKPTKQERKSGRRGKEIDCAGRNTEQVCLVKKKVWQNKQRRDKRRDEKERVDIMVPPSEAGDQTTSSTPAFTPSCVSQKGQRKPARESSEVCGCD